jgi:hypothetical protein
MFAGGLLKGSELMREGPPHRSAALGAAKGVGGSRVSADGKWGPGIGNPDQAKQTAYGGRPRPKNPRYSGSQSLFGVCCLRLQRLSSSEGVCTGTLMAPNKSIWLFRVASRARRIGFRVPSVRVWRLQEALLVSFPFLMALCVFARAKGR